MYIRNKSGPRILPCGTPEMTGRADEKQPLILTCCLLPVKYSFNQLHVFPVMPVFHSFNNNSLCGTVSNAFLKSRYMTSQLE